MPEPSTETDEQKVEREAQEARDRREREGREEREAREQEAALGAAGKAALDREREARKQADRERKAEKDRADALQKDLDKRVQAEESEKERLEREAQEGRDRAATATATIRRANLVTALAEEDLVGAKAKAAVRLLDGLEYDDEDEPTNLVDRITAAKAEYGEDLFQGARPTETDEQKTAREARERQERDRQDLLRHQGDRSGVEPNDAEKINRYLSQNLPGRREPAATA